MQDEMNIYELALSLERDGRKLIVCAVPECPHSFFYVEDRQFPGLCLDHSKQAQREQLQDAATTREP